MATHKFKSPLFIFLILAIILGALFVANPQQALAAQSDNNVLLAPTITTSPSPTVPPAPSITATGSAPKATLQAITPSATESPSQIFSCAEAWGASNSQIRSGSPWLSSSFSKGEDLKTKVKYEYLAGRLLRYGLVSAPECPNNGLTVDGNASQCGVDTAYPKVVEWQNLFNDSILQASNTYMIPPLVIKGVFAQESQFWPGYYKNTWEAGLGHFTDNGADTALGWNYHLYSQVCAGGFDQGACKKTYFQFSPGEQAILRGQLFSQIDATCSTCAGGVSIDKANQSVAVFSQAIYAHCAQTGQIIRNSTNIAPAKSTSYEDLWKITLADYNAGPGCITNAVKKAKSAGLAITWANLSQKLDTNCQGAIRYVNSIENFGLDLESPLPTQIATQSPTPTVSSSPTKTSTPTTDPSQLPTMTPTSPSESTITE